MLFQLKTKDQKNKEDQRNSPKIDKLKSMFDEELITQEEYDAKRKEILDEIVAMHRKDPKTPRWGL